MEVSHEEALMCANTLQEYCNERFDTKLGIKGCKPCIFSVGGEQKRCILVPFLADITLNEQSRKAVYIRYKELSK